MKPPVWATFTHQMTPVFDRVTSNKECVFFPSILIKSPSSSILPWAASSAFFLSSSSSIMTMVVVGMVVEGGRMVTPGVAATGGISSGLKPRRISLRWTVWPVCLSTSTACWLVYPWMFTPSTCRGRSFVRPWIKGGPEQLVDKVRVLNYDIFVW